MRLKGQSAAPSWIPASRCRSNGLLFIKMQQEDIFLQSHQLFSLQRLRWKKGFCGDCGKMGADQFQGDRDEVPGAFLKRRIASFG